MKSSEFDGQQVLYIDNLKLKHSGVIVGQSEDAQRILVRSDNPNVSDAPWHFSVAREIISGVLVA